jgi:hypothetical protein
MGQTLERTQLSVQVCTFNLEPVVCVLRMIPIIIGTRHHIRLEESHTMNIERMDLHYLVYLDAL